MNRSLFTPKIYKQLTLTKRLKLSDINDLPLPKECSVWIVGDSGTLAAFCLPFDLAGYMRLHKALLKLEQRIIFVGRINHPTPQWALEHQESHHMFLDVLWLLGYPEGNSTSYTVWESEGGLTAETKRADPWLPRSYEFASWSTEDAHFWRQQLHHLLSNWSTGCREGDVDEWLTVQAPRLTTNLFHQVDGNDIDKYLATCKSVNVITTSTSSSSSSSSSSSAGSIASPKSEPNNKSRWVAHLRNNVAPEVYNELDRFLHPDLVNIVLLYHRRSPPRGIRTAVPPVPSMLRGPGTGGISFWRNMLLAADYYNNTIRVVDLASGRLVRSFGQCHKVQDSMGCPYRLVANDQDNRAYVIEHGDWESTNISVWNLEDGTFVCRWTYPTHLYYSAKDMVLSQSVPSLLYISDSHGGSVRVYDKQGQLLPDVGKPGHFHSPTALSWCADQLFVLEESERCISIWSTPDHTFLRKMSSGEYALPMGIATGHEWIAVSDYYQRNISIFNLVTGACMWQWNWLSGGVNDHEWQPFSLRWSERNGVLAVSDGRPNGLLLFR